MFWRWNRFSKTSIGQEAMKQSLGRTTEHRGRPLALSAAVLRASILEEERLQRDAASDEELSRTRPEIWGALEAQRRAANRDLEATNRRLRGLGLEPVRPRPSLAQRRQELQRLKQRNVAATAAFTREQAKSTPQPHRTRAARRRSGRSDD